jgi:uncharacterized protein YegP (UPF0339 family)
MSDLKWEFYQDAAEQWRWRATSKQNGKIVGAATQGFASKQKAIENAKLMGYK